MGQWVGQGEAVGQGGGESGDREVGGFDFVGMIVSTDCFRTSTLV